MKISLKMTEAGYAEAKKVYHQEISVKKAIENLSKNFGMDRGSASDYIVNFNKMMKGEKYTRTNNKEATDYFFTKILADYGTEKLEDALNSATEHVDYYDALGNGNLVGVRKIINTHRDILKSLLNNTDIAPFFNVDEIEFFKKWVNRVYDPTNPDHVSAKNYLLETVWNKTKYWSEEVSKKLSHYETSNRAMWSMRGWDNGERVSKFKPYTWARIFKKGDKERDIFFTIGVDALSNCLVYKLDYYHEADSRLTNEQKELCKKYIPVGLKWNEFSEKDLLNGDWQTLIAQTVDFISKNSHHYDQIVKLVFGETKLETVFTNNLTLRNFPEDGLSELPVLNPSFKGLDVDFVKKNREDKELGDYGEELVLEYEKNKLKVKGLTSLIEEVKIVKDGNGFDVLSFNGNGNKIYIEVKTTKGNDKTPFYLSQNEKMFFEQNSENYYIYRLFNYDLDKNYADFFIVENLDEDLLFQPIQYRVFIKKK